MKSDQLAKSIKEKLIKGLIAPVKSLRMRYLPLLAVYFAYGASFVSNISISFWIKDDLNLTAVQIASVGVWVGMPWTIKMIWGQLIDTFPLFGSRRKAYVFLGSGVTAVGLLLLALLAGGNRTLIGLIGQFGLFLTGSVLMAAGYSIQDAAADTMTTEVVPRYSTPGENGHDPVPRPAADVQADLAMVQVLGRLSLSIGILSVAKLGGYVGQLAQEGTFMSYRSVFLGMLLIPLISSTGAALVRLESDSSGNKDERRRFDVSIIAGGLVLGMSSLFFGLIRAFGEGRTALASYTDELIFIISLAVLCWMVHRICSGKSKDSRDVLYRTMAALFIYRMCPAVGAGLTWWMIDVLGFTPSFFGTLDQIGAVVPLVVLWLLSDTIAHKPVRTVLIFLIFTGSVLSLPELLLYYGGPSVQLNARIIAAFDTALESPLANISMVPLLTLIALHAPPENRGTWFAVAASLLNLALSGARLGTKYLNMLFVISREIRDSVTGTITTAADYSQLGRLMIVKLLIMLIVPMLAVLLLMYRNGKTEKT